MTSRDRVKAAVHFHSPDRMPHYLPDDGPNDILWLWPGCPEDIRPWHEENGRTLRTDCWGIVWETKGQGSYGEAVEPPVEDITRHPEYQFPDLNNPVYLAPLAELIAANNRSSNPLYCLGVMPFSSLNEGAHNAMGLFNMLLSYYEHPDELKAFIARLAQAQRRSIEMLSEIGCDAVMAYDDWGLQERQMISTEFMEEFFMPFYRENWGYAHELGMDVWMHSCGYTIDLQLMFAEAGLNVLQIDQQENMGLENIDSRAGGKLAYWCPVDIQKTMPEGSLEDIERYVKRLVSTLGNHNGGLISMSYSSPEAVGHTPEKIAAMCKAFRKYERLGLV